MIEKTLGLLLMPAGVLWVLMIFATLWHWRRSKSAGRWFLAFTLLFWLCGNAQFGNWLMQRLESHISRQDPLSLEPFDAVYIFGGGTELDGSRRPELSEFGDRVALGAMLWHAHRTRCLVTGGAFGAVKGFERNLGEETRSIWLRLGVPDEAIVFLDHPCFNTRDEIAALKQAQSHQGWHRLGLVSSAWHLPRVLALARASGLEGVPIGSDWQGRPRAFQLQDLIPQAKGFRRVQLAMWEILGRISGH